MTKTLVGTPDPDDVEVKFLTEMATKTDVELVSAYVAALAAGQAWIHPHHVARILKLAAIGLPTGK